MKQNVLIVSIYTLGFILLNMIVIAIVTLNPSLISNEEQFLEISINANIAFYFVTSIILGIVFRKYIVAQFKSFKNNFIKYTVTIFLGIVGIYGAAIVIGLFFQMIGVSDNADNQQSILEMIEASTPIQLVLIVAFITVLAPVVEELVFRKGIYGIIGKLSTDFMAKFDIAVDVKKRHLMANIIAIIFSSFAFGLIHATDVYILLYGGLGIVLGIVYFMTNKNVMSSIAVHMIYNTISLLVTILVL